MFIIAAAVLEELRPATYWLDDDLRLGVGKVGCFCARCLAAFGEQVGRPISREELERRLFRGDELDAIRLEWIKFNEQSLAAYGRVVREAANATMPGCRLALQTVSADALLNGRDYGPVLEALSDGGKVPSGVRPGHGCYTEERPMAFLEKALWVTREAERCRRLGAVCGTVCYEEETYPRKVLHKSPNAIVNECALALASGCDTLSLYWADGEAPEYVEDCERFVKAVAGARRYFERLSASTRRTSLGGVARYLGARACEQRGFSLGDGADLALARCGIPVTVAEATAPGKAWFVTERSKKAMTAADWKALEKTGFLEVVPTPYPKVSTRRRWLDRLDRLTDGKFPVRIDRAHALRVLPRMRSDGKVDSVTLFNLSMGDADELKVRVRNPGGAAPVWMEPGGRESQPVSAADGALPGEVVLRIPNLRGWQVGTVFF